jgi:hypothetical protein
MNENRLTHEVPLGGREGQLRREHRVVDLETILDGVQHTLFFP